MREFGDLRSWLTAVDKMGELTIIEGADWDQEIGCAAALNAQTKEPSALLFDNIKDYPKGYRVLTSSLTKPSRVALTLGFPTDYSATGLQDALREALPEWHKTWPDYPPAVVESGPVMENIVTKDRANLFAFPAPKWCQKDGGRYIGTGGAVITRDRDSGQVNLGTYRTMVQDEKSATFNILPGKHGRFQYESYHSRGEASPVAISFGHDPLLFMVSCVNLPPGSEYQADVCGTR